MQKNAKVSAAQRATATFVGRKSPGTKVESTNSKEQDPCVRFPSHGSAIATVMWTSGDTTCQLNGAYSCADVHIFPGADDLSPGACLELPSRPVKIVTDNKTQQ